MALLHNFENKKSNYKKFSQIPQELNYSISATSSTSACQNFLTKIIKVTGLSLYDISTINNISIQLLNAVNQGAINKLNINVLRKLFEFGLTYSKINL